MIVLHDHRSFSLNSSLFIKMRSSVEAEEPIEQLDYQVRLTDGLSADNSFDDIKSTIFCFRNSVALQAVMKETIETTSDASNQAKALLCVDCYKAISKPYSVVSRPDISD